MSTKTRVILAVLWVLSLVVTSQLTTRAQQASSAPQILSGPDLGFRVEGQWNGKPMGSIVIRVNGQWVKPETAIKQQPATVR